MNEVLSIKYPVLKEKMRQGFTLIRTLLRKNLDKAQPLCGFTLIELLVVISILGILAGFGVARYLTAEKQARDTQRKSDLSQYRIALENYSSANDTAYPKPVTCGAITVLCNLSNFQTNYLSGSCLQDPRLTTNGDYNYCSDGLRYALWAKLETGSNDYFIVCSNGRSGKKTYATGQPDIAGGACPLSN